MPGKAGADFTARRLGGPEFHMAAAKGKIVLLNVWSTNRGPCLKETKSFNEIKARCHNKNILFLAIAPSDDKYALRRFLKLYLLDYDILFAPDPTFVPNYQAKAYPTNYLIGPDGRFIFTNVGYQEKMRLRLIR